jgi:hypothetical protein
VAAKRGVASPGVAWGWPWRGAFGQAWRGSVLAGAAIGGVVAKQVVDDPGAQAVWLGVKGKRGVEGLAVAKRCGWAGGVLAGQAK